MREGTILRKDDITDLRSKSAIVSRILQHLPQSLKTLGNFYYYIAAHSAGIDYIGIEPTAQGKAKMSTVELYEIRRFRYTE